MSALFDENTNVVSGTLHIGSGVTYDITLSETSGVATVFNRNNLNVDFKVEGTGASSYLYYDASAGRLGIDTSSPDAALHVVSPCANEGAIIESVTNCPTGVRLLLLHNSQTPPEDMGYPATIDLAGRDENYNQILFGQIKSQALNTETDNTSGALIFSVDHTGVSREIFRSSYVDTVLGGNNTIASGTNLYDIVGYNNSISSGSALVVVGSNNTSFSSSGVIIGHSNSINGDQSVLVSVNTDSDGDNNISLSVNSIADGDSSIFLGQSISLTGSSGTLIGNNLSVVGDSNLGLLSSTNIVGESGIGFGISSNIIGDNHIYVGHNIDISGTNNMAIGSNTYAYGNNNIVYGNDANASASNVISIGESNSLQNYHSGIFIGNNISLPSGDSSVIIGLGNSSSSGLLNSILLGINNTASDATPSGLVVIGQSNIVTQISESLVVGNTNNLSGNVSNNIVIGPRNSVPDTSFNNLILGLLNNTTGIVINSDGSISGTDIRMVDSDITNTNVFGINNALSAASGSSIVGNKTRISGLNVNNLGSYTNLNGSHIQSLGNSNFIIGNYATAIGGMNDIFGTGSISINTSTERNQLFGNDTIVMGGNEVIVSGISVGSNNEIYGPNNIVYGKNNTVGLIRYPCRVSGSNVVIVGSASEFNGGDKILVALYSPATQDNPVYIRTILDGTDPVTGDPIGIITENIGSNFTTTLITNSTIQHSNTIEYYVKNNFDNIIQGYDPCSECFSDLFAGYASGYVMAYQDGNSDTDLETFPLYGNHNIILGSNNDMTHYSGIILGNNNNISGINHIALGYNLSGNFNNTIQIGTNNDNKVIISQNSIIFNSGQTQNSIFVQSSRPGLDNNENTSVKFDNDLNRVGFNNDAPRSTIDVSGTVTTNALRVGLTSPSGYTLTSNASGFATWQFPVNLYGQNGGFLQKLDDKRASGIKEIAYNPASGAKSWEYLRANKVLDSTFEFIDEFSTEERVFIINQSGLYLNNEGNDYGYNLVIKGSGIQAPVNGDNAIYLFKTNIPENEVRMQNLTFVSGDVQEFKVTDSVILPTSLTGTILKVDNNGNLGSISFDRHDLLFSNSEYETSGTTALRYYPTSQALTIGQTGTPPETAEAGLLTGGNNLFNNIILSSAQNTNTVFNNAGLSNQFIIVENNQAGTKQGFHYYTNSGALGIGVNDSNLWNVSSTNTNQPWWNAGKLIVNGKARVSSLQLTPGGTTLPGASAVNKYLKIVDVDGNVGLDTLDLQYQFSGIHPISVATDAGNQIVTVRLATTNSSQVSLSSNENGLGLVWNGASWVHGRGFKLLQPENGSTNTDVTPGIELGNDLSLNACRNNHVEGAGSFARGQDNWKGSSQVSKFFLRGRTGGAVDSELTADWHKNSNTTPNVENTISLQYLDDYDNQTPIDHKQSFVWNYTIDYSAIFSDDAGTPTFGGCGGKVEGTILSYIASDGTRTNTKLGSDTIIKRYTTVDYSVQDPIDIIIKDTGADLNVQRLAIVANGVSNYNALWSVNVEINQVFVPSGISFGNSDII